MGFRAQAGPLHLAQLLSNLMVLQQRRGHALWLASFDVEKCPRDSITSLVGDCAPGWSATLWEV